MIGRIFCKVNLHAYVVVKSVSEGSNGVATWVCGRHGCQEAGQYVQ